jgi:hypothetical protein
VNRVVSRSPQPQQRQVKRKEYKRAGESRIDAQYRETRDNERHRAKQEGIDDYQKDTRDRQTGRRHDPLEDQGNRSADQTDNSGREQGGLKLYHPEAGEDVGDEDQRERA